MLEAMLRRHGPSVAAFALHLMVFSLLATTFFQTPTPQPTLANVVNVFIDHAPESAPSRSSSAVTEPNVEEIALDKEPTGEAQTVAPVPEINSSTPESAIEAVATPEMPQGVVEALATSRDGGEIDCHIAEGLQLYFQTDGPIRNALSHVAPESKSVANAIMLWDGRWVIDRVPGDRRALETVRIAIERVIHAAPPECQIADVTGPHFIVVQTDSRPIVLVLGSGAWRWSDLV